MQLKELTKDEFNNLTDLNKILCNVEYPRRFALLTTAEYTESFGICWESDIIQPQIIDDEESPFLWLGVDRQIIAVKKDKPKISVAMKLQSNLLELKKIKDLILCRCELEIICFSIYGFLTYFQNLPEISESFIVKSNKITINLIDENSFILPEFLLK